MESSLSAFSFNACAFSVRLLILICYQIFVQNTSSPFPLYNTGPLSDCLTPGLISPGLLAPRPSLSLGPLTSQRLLRLSGPSLSSCLSLSLKSSHLCLMLNLLPLELTLASTTVSPVHLYSSLPLTPHGT